MFTGADGYGRFWVCRGGRQIMVRANRYALATAPDGKTFESWMRALHGWDNPSACARACPETRVCCASSAITNQAHRARAVALREAVRYGWDAEAIEASVIGID